MKTMKKCRYGMVLILIAQLAMPPAMFAQQSVVGDIYGSVVSNLPSVAADQLPIIRDIDPDDGIVDGFIHGVAGRSYPAPNQMIIHQDKPRAILEWEQFNIGANAWTHFDQQGNTNWAALNKIYDQNPSLIFGKLSADGQVFLLNQNGILFGPGSQINVHALTASSLDMAVKVNVIDTDGNTMLTEFSDDVNVSDFIRNNESEDTDFEVFFTDQDGAIAFTGDGNRGAVSNHGNIQVGTGGTVYLVAPDVENAGTIDAPSGQVGMAAGSDVKILAIEEENRLFPHIYVQSGTGGTATNMQDGHIHADTGIAGLYGRNVNQDGYIRSITAITNQGRIELHASEKVTTGANSVTETPITEDSSQVHSSFDIAGGEIEIDGLDQLATNAQTGELQTEKAPSPERIEHYGHMNAPSGSIAMSAKDRIYLGAGSLLDVSGEWNTRVDAAAVAAQLNSMELKNDYSQKDGILQGQEVQVDPKVGSSIGDLSTSLNGEFLTAREMATTGGTIEISAVDESDPFAVDSGDIIVRDGAVIDFSGGGIIVTDGSYDTTKLVSGNRIYDIGDAPVALRYSDVASYHEKVYERYGIIDQYEGFYLGSGNPLISYNTGYIQGDDAGQLTLRAGGIVIDGVIDGTAIAGIYQTDVTADEEFYGNFAVLKSTGTKAPRGGRLIIGTENPVNVAGRDGDHIVDEVVIAATAPSLPESFGPADDLKSTRIGNQTPFSSDYSDDQGPLYRTVLTAEKLNAAGLSDLSVNANTKITVEADAELKLHPGGLRIDETVDYVNGVPLQYIDLAPASITLQARAIEHHGRIEVPSGNAYALIANTITTPNIANTPTGRTLAMNQRILIAEGSSVDVAGEKVDNALAIYGRAMESGFINGGNIFITDSSEAASDLILAPGSLLDVSAGYELDHDGIAAGSAGSIEISGKAMAVAGGLKGFSLLDQAGGSITFKSSEVFVRQRQNPTLSVPHNFGDPLTETGFVLGENQLANSGFTHITLESATDLTVASGVTLEPSLVKMAYPVTEAYLKSGVLPVNVTNPSAGSPFNQGGINGLITVPMDFIGDSSFTLKAGTSSTDDLLDTFAVNLAEGATIEVAPGGSIELSGLVADIAGSLIAPAGSVSISATGIDRDLILRSSSSISAPAYHLPQLGSSRAGIGQIYLSLDGGSVDLAALNGNIITEAGSLIDISGSMPLQSLFYEADGSAATRQVAGNAGTLLLSYQDQLSLGGAIIGHAQHSSKYGATLSIQKSSLLDELTIGQAMIDRYIQEGFDALIFSSLKEIRFMSNIHAQLYLAFGLDAPLISGSGSQQISFNAPWIALANSQTKYGDATYDNDSYRSLIEDDQSLMAGDALSSLSLSGEFIDVTGGIALAGFASTALNAAADLRLYDEAYYDQGGLEVAWKGQLRTAGDLKLAATRIYPGTHSDFTLASDFGRIRIRPGSRSANGPIASAGGALTLAAEDIDHMGYLAAPMGRIRFRGSLQDTQDDLADTVFLADGSVTSVTSTSRVQYGTLEDDYWTIETKPKILTRTNLVQPTIVESSPEKSINIAGNTVVQQTGAVIDVSGGGAVFASQFLPGADGLVNPFSSENIAVIVPGVYLPGNAIQHLFGEDLSAGTYSLLPEAYAHMEDAYVVESLLRSNTEASILDYTEEGFPVGAGYLTLNGTGFTSSLPEYYSIRPATDVFQEGDFNIKEIVAGNAGSVSISGKTTILDGSLVSNALPGFKGGFLSFSGTQSAVVRGTASIGSEYRFEDIQQLIGTFRNTAQILDATISDGGLNELAIGTTSITDTVTVAADTLMEVPIIRLSAKNSILIEQNSDIIANHVTFDTPEGLFEMRSGSSVVTTRADIIARSAVFDGTMSSDGGALGITAENIVVTNNLYTGDRSDGLYLNDSMQGFIGFDDLELLAVESVTFLGNNNLTVNDTMTIDTRVIKAEALDGAGASQTTLGARSMNLVNTGTAPANPGLAGSGELSLAADTDIVIGHGDIVLDGFQQVNMNAGGDIAVSGKGSFVSSGDLTMTAARLTATYYQDTQTDYEAANFHLQAGDTQNGYRDIHILPVTGNTGQTLNAGGNLSMLGNSISHAGTIDIAGGWVAMQAAGSDQNGNGITLTGAAKVDVSGNDALPGGRVWMAADAGSILLDTGSAIDLSAGSQGDAGLLSIAAPQASVLLNGTIDGRSDGGQGGSFIMDTGQMVDTALLYAALGNGGFDQMIDLRTRAGNIDLTAADTIRAHQVKLTADAGKVSIAGTIDASGTHGGKVEVNAYGDPDTPSDPHAIYLSGMIDASADSNAGGNGDGGSVILNAADKQLTLEGGAINVSANGAGGGGNVHLRANQKETVVGSEIFDDVQMELNGSVTGADKVTVEGVRRYDYAQNKVITSVDIMNTYHAHADTFWNNRGAVSNRLTASGLTLADGSETELQIVPGIEIASTGDLTLAATWDLTSLGKSNQAGVITLRAAGNLTLNQSLVDHPTPMQQLNDGLVDMPDSWGVNLVAGADLASADPLSTRNGNGDLTIAANQMVYTQNAPLRFASGRDTTINSAPGYAQRKYMVNFSMGYNLATFNGDIQGVVGRDLNIQGGGAIQSAIGDIDLSIGRDLYLQVDQLNGSAIRTTGTAPPNAQRGGFDWLYAETYDGGAIRLNVGGDIQMSSVPFTIGAGSQPSPHLRYWDNAHVTPSIEAIWSADYGETSAQQATPTAGIATMGGGSLSITAGGDVFGQMGTFKDGEFELMSQGNIDGFFQVANEKGSITAAGNIGTSANASFDTSLALFDAQVSVQAYGSVDFGTAFNPTFLRQYTEYSSVTSARRYLDYGLNAAVKLTAVTGDLVLSSQFWKENDLDTLDADEANAYRVIPQTVNLSAGGDIWVLGNLVLAPSPDGSLSMQASGDISGLYTNLSNQLRQATVRLSDLDPVEIYRLTNVVNDPVQKLFAEETLESAHADQPLHMEDDTPVTIIARGDISELRVITPKQSRITSGGDICGLYYFGQNLQGDDETIIRAMGNIELSSLTNPVYRNTGMRSGGPGLFMVQAGGSINLGTTQGIQSVGSSFYSALGEENSSLALIAGFIGQKDAQQLTSFFSDIKTYGTEYSEYSAQGDSEDANELLARIRNEVIESFFSEGARSTGNINMTSSSIQTNAEVSDLFIIATGDINVGLTTIPDPADIVEEAEQADTGIFTTKGGNISIYSDGDLNVNESRVMTFRGGNITAWSDQGNINAGRGSKTAVNAGSPRIVSIKDDEGNVIGKRIEWEAPSVGSGIRTLTYDPDGFQGPLKAPLAGDALLFAPEGIIDAGEAGIGGRNVILAATEVRNAENIEVAGTGVGVPQANTGPTVGALVGAGTISETSKIVEESSAMKSAEERFSERVTELSEQLVPKWIAVEVVGFEEKKKEI